MNIKKKQRTFLPWKEFLKCCLQINLHLLLASISNVRTSMKTDVAVVQDRQGINDSGSGQLQAARDAI